MYMISRRTVSFFRQGRCSFPERVCWNRPTNTPAIVPTTKETSKPMECYDCRKMFKNKGDLMKHRKSAHIEKLKVCKYGDKCSFSLCWYRHKETESDTVEPTTEEAELETTETNTVVEEFPKGPGI